MKRAPQPDRPAVRISVVAIATYAFAAAVFYLAAAYLGGAYPYVFSLLIVLPVVDLLYVVLCVRTLEIRITTTPELMVRGAEHKVTARLRNRSPIPQLGWIVHSFASGPGHDTQHEHGRAVAIPGRMERRINRTLSCPHRGNYRLGIGPIELGDPLSWITIRLRGVSREFHVYPRIHAANVDIRGSAGAIQGENPGNSRSLAADPSDFRGLIEYREGMPIKHIAWRKFAAHGTPYVKQYDSSESTGVSIYLDLRKPVGDPETVLTRQDLTIELLVAIVKRLLEQYTPVEVHALGADVFSFTAADPSLFDEFYRSTSRLTFGHVGSPRRLLDTHRREQHGQRPLVVAITHTPDTELFTLPALSSSGGTRYRVVANVHGWPWEQFERNRSLAASLLPHDTRGDSGVILIDSMSRLAEGIAL